MLVIVVVYLFLQGWRATLIPLLAVPVSLVGTFIFFPLFGFSINTLSLFGLVLAIGLVVDDAIVVVEAVERHIEEGLAPKEAALKAMEEISGPVIGIALVLSAVFVPTAFIPGITGRLYQQFAVTIAISVMLSAFNALTLSPALAALLLQTEDAEHEGLLRKFFDWFNRVFGRATERLCALVRRADPQERRRVRRCWSVSALARLVLRQQAAHQLPARRGPGLHLHAPAASQRRVAPAHRSGRAQRSRQILANTPGVQVHHRVAASAC